MDYRDDRDALREELEAARQNEERTAARADRAEAELARARETLTELESELRALRSQARAAAPPSSTSTRTVALVAGGALVVAAAVGFGAYAFVSMRRVVAPNAPDAPRASTDAAVEEVAVAPISPKKRAGGGVDDPAAAHLPKLKAAGVVPSIVHLAGETRDDILGVDKEGEQLFLSAIEGEKFETVWRFGPFGPEKGAHGFVQLVAVGDRVFLSDADARGAIFALATGKKLFDVTLPDRFRNACAVPGRAAVWATTSDRGEFEIDLEHGTATPHSGGTCAHPASHAATHELGSEERGDVKVLFTLGAGNDAIAVGTRRRGRPALMALGGGTGGWSTTLTDADEEVTSPNEVAADVAGGRLFLSYPPDHSRATIVAVDVKTGARVWASPLKSHMGASPWDVLLATPRRVFLFGWHADVFDAKTGALLATSG